MSLEHTHISSNKPAHTRAHTALNNDSTSHASAPTQQHEEHEAPTHSSDSGSTSDYFVELAQSTRLDYLRDTSTPSSATELYINAAHTQILQEETRDRSDLQELVDSLFAERPHASLSIYDVLLQAELLDLSPRLNELIAALPTTSYSREKLCNQLNSLVCAAGLSRALERVS